MKTKTCSTVIVILPLKVCYKFYRVQSDEVMQKWRNLYNEELHKTIYT